MQTKSERTKQFIIEKAAPVFNRKGYAATSMNDILKATGLAKGGVYGNFESKDEIALKVFEYSYGLIKQALVARIKAEPTAVRKLGSILDFYKNYTLTPQLEGGCPLLNTATEADDNIPFLKQSAAAALKEMLASLERIIQKGIDNGEFNKISVAKEACLFFSVIEGGIMLSQIMDHPKYLNNNLELLRQRIENMYIK